MPAETWQSIPGFPNYEASTFARIRNIKTGRILKTQPHQGYLKVTLNKGGKRKLLYLHRVICRTFHGNPPHRRMHCAHIDGHKQNNKPSNLYWATPSENAHDRYRHGALKRGQNHPRAKLSDIDLDEIRALSEFATNTELACWFKVSRGYISCIINFKKRTHATP